MADSITIALDTSVYRQPTAEDIRSAKQYILQRNDDARTLAGRIDDILEDAAERIVRICYRYNVNPEEFFISSQYNEQLMKEIADVMDETEEAIYDLIFEYAANVTSDKERQTLLIAWMATLGRGNRNLRDTIDGYLYKTMKDWEAAIAAMRASELTLAEAITKIRSFLHNIYTMPEVTKAFKQASSFNATYIRSKGVMQGGVGLSNNGSTNVTNMAKQTIQMVYMRNQAMEFEDGGAVGYYQLRGSNYNCDACDEEVGFHPNIQEIYDKPMVHPHCCCYRVPIYANDNILTE